VSLTEVTHGKRVAGDNPQRLTAAMEASAVMILMSQVHDGGEHHSRVVVEERALLSRDDPRPAATSRALQTE
jgi:hypothetical protein